MMISAISCGDDCIEGSGNVIEETRSLTDYNAISNSSTIDVNITSGSSLDVLLQGEDNILEVLDLSVDNDVLEVLTTESCIMTTESVSLELMNDALRMISNSGTGNISGNISIGEIEINSSGTGDIDLEPRMVNSVIINSEGTSNVDIDRASVEASTITNSGTGDIYVWVSGTLQVTISGTGDVYYKGNPSILSTISGTGELIDNN